MTTTPATQPRRPRLVRSIAGRAALCSALVGVVLAGCGTTVPNASIDGTSAGSGLEQPPATDGPARTGGSAPGGPPAVVGPSGFRPAGSAATPGAPGTNGNSPHGVDAPAPGLRGPGVTATTVRIGYQYV